jgi:hypothetical protein
MKYYENGSLPPTQIDQGPGTVAFLSVARPKQMKAGTFGV